MKRVLKYLFLVVGVLIAIPVILWFLGTLLPEAHRVSVSKTLDVPQEEVYRLITDIKNYPNWRSNVIEVQFLRTDGQPEMWREIYSDNDPIAFRIHKPDSTIVYTEIISQDLPFGGEWFFSIEPHGSGTKLTINEQGEVYNPLFRFISAYVIGHDKTIRQYLADIESVKEGS